MQTGASEEKAVRLLDPGDMFGDYTVEKLLGQGGMGAVYLVRAPGGERYAVKVMFPDMVKKGSDYRKRFAREAEFAMQIHHKNLISVYDVGEDPETGLCYIIMDYVPGGSVADRLENNGPLPMAEAVSIAAQVALALEVAHRHGVIHRDIKPENIMFDADGTPKLADLGVAKFTDEAHKTTVTTTGMIIGTPAYMAPEQMMDSHHVDARADIYAAPERGQHGGGAAREGDQGRASPRCADDAAGDLGGGRARAFAHVRAEAGGAPRHGARGGAAPESRHGAADPPQEAAACGRRGGAQEEAGDAVGAPCRLRRRVRTWRGGCRQPFEQAAPSSPAAAGRDHKRDGTDCHPDKYGRPCRVRAFAWIGWTKVASGTNFEMVRGMGQGASGVAAYREGDVPPQYGERLVPLVHETG